VRFSDHRRTLTKGQPLPDDMARNPEDLTPVPPATPRWIAPPKVHPDNLQPAYNRASRRQGGHFRSQRRSALRRARRRAERMPLPWKAAA
jgi:hypothetical protein